MRRALDRLHRRLLDERGYSLVELIVVCTILLIVLSSLTTVFVSATRAELSANKRFQAQQNVRLALDTIRRDAHRACSATVTAGSVALFPCGAGVSPYATWCTVGSGLRWGLYRQTVGSCSSAAVRKADYLTTGNVFCYIPPSDSPFPGTFAKLGVSFPVDIDTSSSSGTYLLSDRIALRNSTRTPSAVSPTCS